MRVAYLMSRFPKISETFILYEILELQRLGLEIEIFPLLRQSEQVHHPGVEELMDRVRFTPAVSREVAAAQIYWLLRRPAAYLGAWIRVLWGNLASPRFLARALVVVPLAAAFARRMRQLGVSHVHAHWATHPTLAAYVIRMLAKLPYSFTAHAHDIHVDRAMLGEKIRRASFVVTISDYNLRLLSELYGSAASDKTEVIRCGVDAELFKPPRIRPGGSRFSLVCVAQLEERKGHEYLLQACALLGDRGVDFHCLLIGEGGERSRIEAQIVRLGLQGRVELAGARPRDKVLAALASAEVMVLPSIIDARGKQEGIPVALMEAMAMELPVVATSISGIPELVEDRRTGLLVAERDAEALCEALHQLHESPELRAALGAAARNKVLQEYDLRRNAERLARRLCLAVGALDGSGRAASDPWAGGEGL